MDKDEIFESIFKRDISHEDNISFLKQISKEHPYFSAARFFLLQQTDPENIEFKERAAMAGLHFNNPLWLNYLLKKENLLAEQPLQNNIAASVQNQKDLANKDLNTVEAVQECDANVVEQSSNDNSKKEIQVETKNPVAISPEQMLFEPMHMVDYFASQGIKLSEAVQTGDKLGLQLKSFTEWLKTMKKVHVEKQAENQAPTDLVVQNLAEKSNTEGEILTEAMAEVFAMQGKHSKAIEVYEKLSLLNPSKSAYFAAKILPLKG